MHLTPMTMAAAHLTAATSSSPITYAQAAILGILQGVTELFPVSSLGHTILFPSLFGWDHVVQAQSNPESFWLAFVVMLHGGSAIGLLIYFWRDWVKIVRGFFQSLAKRKVETPYEHLAWLIVIATIPAGILGLLFEHPLRVALAKPMIAAVFLTINGVMLLGAERLRRSSEVRAVAARAGAVGDAPRELDTLNYKEAGAIGLAQSTALIPGISRDGVCMTAGLIRGLDHEESARFAFLLATPIILAATLFKLPDLTGPLGAGVRTQALVAALFAAASAVASVAFLLRYFKTKTLTPFGIYCLIFGVFNIIYLSVN